MTKLTIILGIHAKNILAFLKGSKERDVAQVMMTCMEVWPEFGPKCNTICSFRSRLPSVSDCQTTVSPAGKQSKCSRGV